MFEFEIMLAGYSVVLVATSAIISRLCCKKQISKLQTNITELNNAVTQIRDEFHRLSKN